MGGEPASRQFVDRNGHLDDEAVIDRMVAVCPALEPVLREDQELIGGLPCLQVSWIAKALVGFAQSGDRGRIEPVLQIAEQVLADFGQEGRDFIGACFAEGIPQGGERVLAKFAGPLLLREMASYLDASHE